MAHAPMDVSVPHPVELPRLLVVTNDFPPRIGGVQRYVHDLVRHLDPDRVGVFAPRWDGCVEFDQEQAFRVDRYGGTFLAPTSDAARRVRSLVRESGAELVLFGHALPLGVLGPGLAAAGVPYAMLSHGAEVWMAKLPVIRHLLAWASARAEVVFAVSSFTGRALRRAVPPNVPIEPLPPGVDERRFHPRVSGAPVRERHGLGDGPLVVCISRLVPRKGQDTLIGSWPQVRGRVPGARLLIVGEGPERGRLERLAMRTGGADEIVFAGGVSEAELPAYYAAADVFAMPCRSRRSGLEVEGFGIVFLEAGATGRAAVAGDSGGAAEAVEHDVTGLVVDGEDAGEVTEAVARLLEDRGLAARLGAAARQRVERAFTWERIVARFARALSAR